MDISIGKGVGSIQFGLTESQVIEQIGKPDKVYELDGSKRIQYFDLRIEVSFESAQGDRFSWVEVKNPSATIFGQKLIGEDVEKVLSVISNVIAEPPEFEDYGSFESYFYENQWLELQFEFNRLRTINIGVLWIDNDTVDWP